MKSLFVILVFSIFSFNAYTQSSLNIKLKCYTTISNDQPLWIVVLKKKNYILDQSSVKLINPNTIENVNVLKDAAATALYGSRAAYGVIVITLKKTESKKEYRRLKPYLEKA